MYPPPSTPLHSFPSSFHHFRLPFRLLVKEYGVGISYTPMILADSFIYSSLARDMEFQLCQGNTKQKHKNDGFILIFYSHQMINQLSYSLRQGTPLNLLMQLNWLPLLLTVSI